MQPDPPAPSTQIALYGGSFDPVHRAHLEVARAVRSALAVDQVIFIPAAQSPLKDRTAGASGPQRKAMLDLAIEAEAGFRVDDCELRRGGTSYTLDTVEDFQRRYPGARLFWIIGADQLEQLRHWARIERLVRKVTFAVLQRPGYSLEGPAIPGLCLERVDAPPMPHNSTDLRQRLRRGQSVTDWLPPAVEAFISSHDLYTHADN
jgi:nicotinate-nucleotide adenylyltransferase